VAQAGRPGTGHGQRASGLRPERGDHRGTLPHSRQGSPEVPPHHLLVRRIKQGVAEYFRLQIKKKAWEGLRQHAIAGWNIGPAPYGYTAQRVTHPVPVKAAQGRTKTRLVLDPQRGPVVAVIYTWRVEEHLGVPTIAARLNADKDRYPPRDGLHWSESTVGAILGNPKYTGHMVFGRRRKTTGRRSQPAPPDQWTWSPEPSRPAIITRAMFDEAQVIGEAHRTASDTPASAQPRARRNYPLRSRVRCRLCQRRMCGSTRSSSRYYTSGPDAWHTYYECTHDPANPRHTALRPDHPRTVSVREDVLLGEIIQFLAQRVFGPERRALLTEQLPATEADAAQQRATHRAALTKELARIDIAQRNQIMQIEGLSPDPADKAAQAMRSRCSQRFTELHTERQDIETQIHAIDATPARDDHAELLDAIPPCPETWPSSPNASRPPSTRHSTCSCSTAKTCTRSPSGPPSPAAPPTPSPPSSTTPATTPHQQPPAQPQPSPHQYQHPPAPPCQH
jgi:site-specific DNA recombinase